MRIAIAAILGSMVVASGPTSQAQDGVDVAYRAALAASPTPRALEAEQILWASDRAAAAASERGHMDEGRIEDLRARLALDRAAGTARPTLAQLLARCLPLGLDGCSAEGGWLRRGDGALLFWQSQRGSTDEDGLTGAFVLLTGDADGPLVPAAWGRGGFYGAPVLLQDEAGTWVAVPGYYGGSGSHNADVVFRWTEDAARRLAQIDNTSWRDDLARRLPAGLEVWKGVQIQYEYMGATTPLWQPDDGNCCATGGSAQLSFSLQGDRLILDDVRVQDRAIEVASSVDPDVLDWVGRVRMCEHWGGEYSDEAERRAQIQQALRTLRCDAVDADGAALKARFADDRDTSALLIRAAPPAP